MDDRPSKHKRLQIGPTTLGRLWPSAFFVSVVTAGSCTTTSAAWQISHLFQPLDSSLLSLLEASPLLSPSPPPLPPPLLLFYPILSFFSFTLSYSPALSWARTYLTPSPRTTLPQTSIPRRRRIYPVSLITLLGPGSNIHIPYFTSTV